MSCCPIAIRVIWTYYIDGGDEMPDYKEMYLTMVRASEKALRQMEEASQILIAAQQKCEELYLADEENESSPN